MSQTEVTRKIYQKSLVRGDWCGLCSQLRASDIHKVGSVRGRKPFCPFNSCPSKEEGRGISGTATIRDSHSNPKCKYCDRPCQLRCDFIIKAYRSCQISSTPFTGELSYIIFQSFLPMLFSP